MKNILVIIMVFTVCNHSFAQCLNIIGQNRDSAVSLLRNADHLLKIDLVQRCDTLGNGDLRFGQPEDSIRYKVWLDNNKMVRHLNISGKKELIQNVFNSLIYPKIYNCIEKHNGLWYFFNHTFILNNTISPHDAEIDIEYRDKM